MYISEAADLLHAVMYTYTEKNFIFDGLCTDTRQLKAGDLFIAIKGDKFDGHDFIAKAKELGAIAALVEHPLDGIKFVQLEVKDTVLALGKLGWFKRLSYHHPLLTVTGSCGKTTTKEMLAAILRQNSSALASIKSFNNHIGVPLTLWQLSDEYQFAVLEVGANHHGEIAYLADLIKPDIAIITNAAPVHLEGFGDMNGVAKAKGELLHGLASNGTAVLNLNDEYYEYWCGLLDPDNQRLITFGLSCNADITATNIKFSDEGYSSFVLRRGHEEIDISLPLLGQHNVMNALAAAAGALAVATPLQQIKAGLESMSPVYRRLVTSKGYAGAKIIDDSYNANPRAVEAVLEMLAKQNGEKILVLGDMLELGEEAAFWHKYVGNMAHDKSINALYAYGKYAEIVAQAFGKGGYVFHDKKELAAALKKTLHPNCVVLVKGSLGAAMDEVVKLLSN